MAKVQHIAGPWRISRPYKFPQGDWINHFHANAGDHEVCIARIAQSGSRSQAEADAIIALMATAPEMLATLKRVKTVMDGMVHPSCRRHGDALSEVEAAIAKAEGRP